MRRHETNLAAGSARTPHCLLLRMILVMIIMSVLNLSPRSLCLDSSYSAVFRSLFISIPPPADSQILFISVHMPCLQLSSGHRSVRCPLWLISVGGCLLLQNLEEKLFQTSLQALPVVCVCRCPLVAPLDWGRLQPKWRFCSTCFACVLIIWHSDREVCCCSR